MGWMVVLVLVCAERLLCAISRFGGGFLVLASHDLCELYLVDSIR